MGTLAATYLHDLSESSLASLLGTVLDFADSCSAGVDMTLLVVRRRDAIKGEQPRSTA